MDGVDWKKNAKVKKKKDPYTSLTPQSPCRKLLAHISGSSHRLRLLRDRVPTGLQTPFPLNFTNIQEYTHTKNFCTFSARAEFVQ
jgi:hypothetical protein